MEYSVDELHSFDDDTLVEIFDKLELSDMVDLAMICSRFENICLKIWHHLKFESFDCFQRLSTPEAFKYFLSMKADEFQSVELFTSDIEIFNEVSEYTKLDMLKKVRLVIDSEECKLVPANFLWRCPNVKYIRISQEAINFYMNTIVDLKTLKILTTSRDYNNFDSVMEQLILRKGPNIKVLSTCMDVFPPKWFSSDIMSQCNQLELLSLDTRNTPIKPFACMYDLVKVPTLPSLRILQIFGNYCRQRLMRLILNCSNLEKIYFDKELVDYLFINDVQMKRAWIGIRTELKIFFNSDMETSSMRMEFKDEKKT